MRYLSREYRGKSLQLYTEIFMEKKNYSKPVLEVEDFFSNHCLAFVTALNCCVL